MSVLRQLEVLETLGEVASLDAPLGDDGDDAPTLGDLVAGDGGGSARAVHRGIMLSTVRDALQRLDPRARLVLLARYGIGAGEWRHEDVADALRMSRPNVARIEAQAIAALRQVLA